MLLRYNIIKFVLSTSCRSFLPVNLPILAWCLHQIIALLVESSDAAPQDAPDIISSPEAATMSKPRLAHADKAARQYGEFSVSIVFASRSGSS